MRRTRRRTRTVRGKPNMLWISSAGDFSLEAGSTSGEAMLIPADWSGTVTETKCTLLRLVVIAYTNALGDPGGPHIQNCAITMSNALVNPSSAYDITLPADWPDFFSQQDRVLHVFNREWSGDVDAPHLNVQYSQLPDPVMNLRTPRLLQGDDCIVIWAGGRYTSATMTPVLEWYCRALVRTGLR